MITRASDVIDAKLKSMSDEEVLKGSQGGIPNELLGYPGVTMQDWVDAVRSEIRKRGL